MSDDFAASSLLLENITNGDAVTISLRGDVDMGTAPQLDAVVTAALDGGAVNISFDCAHLGFIDSTGISVLATAIRRLHAVNSRVKIISCPPNLHSLLHITALAPHVDQLDAPPGPTAAAD